MDTKRGAISSVLFVIAELSLAVAIPWIWPSVSTNVAYAVLVIAIAAFTGLGAYKIFGPDTGKPIQPFVHIGKAGGKVEISGNKLYTSHPARLLRIDETMPGSDVKASRNELRPPKA